MAICRCSRIRSQIESTAARMSKEAAMEMSNGVSSIGFMAFPGVPPPFDNADCLNVRPGLDRVSPAGRTSLLPFAPEAAPRFVSKQARWRRQQGPDQRQALLLSRGQPRDRCVQKIDVKSKARCQGCDLASLVQDKMFDHRVGPPTGFCGYVGCLFSPFRGGDRGGIPPIHSHLAFVWVEVGNHAKKETFTGSRRTGDGGAHPSAEV